MDEIPGIAHAPSTYNPAPYLAALDKLQRNTQRNLTLCRVIIVLAFLLLAPWVALLILEKTDQFFLYILGFIFVIETIPAFWPKLLMGLQAHKYEEQLTHSGLAERIALGELDSQDPVFGHTPWLLRWLLPKNRSGNPVVTLSRVAGSLQWYSASPRLHVKPTWMMALSFLPFLFMIGFNSMMISRVPGLALGFPIAIAIITIPGVIVGSITYKFVMVEMLAKYLRSTWEENQLEVEITPEDVERKAKLQLMLNQVQQDLEKAMATMLLPILLPLVFGMFPILISTIFSLGIFPIIIFALGIPAVVLIIHFWLPKYAYANYRKNLRTKLDDSGIALLIAGGELDVAGLLEHTPWVFRFIHNAKQMPKGFADNLRLLIWRAGLNLDWFMDHPRTLLRPAWITNIALLLVGFGSLVLTFMAPFRMISNLTSSMGTNSPVPSVSEIFAIGNIKWLLLAALIPLAAPGIIHATKTRIWTEELIRHLRSRLAG